MDGVDHPGYPPPNSRVPTGCTEPCPVIGIARSDGHTRCDARSSSRIASFASSSRRPAVTSSSSCLSHAAASKPRNQSRNTFKSLRERPRTAFSISMTELMRENYRHDIPWQAETHVHSPQKPQRRGPPPPSPSRALHAPLSGSFSARSDGETGGLCL